MPWSEKLSTLVGSGSVKGVCVHGDQCEVRPHGNGTAKEEGGGGGGASDLDISSASWADSDTLATLKGVTSGSLQL